MAVATQLQQTDIQERIKQRRDESIQAESDLAEERYRWVRPLSNAANNYVSVAQNTEGRFMLGIQDLDLKTRGFGPGELAFIAGLPGSGKTQLALSAIVNNTDRHILLVTPDETAEAVLSRLVSMRHGIHAEDLESRVKANDSYTLELLHKAATHDFRNLVVVDDVVTLGQMSDAKKEAEDFWGAPADLVIIDYLELIPGNSDVAATTQALKRWTKKIDTPVAVLHHNKRSSDRHRGQAQGLDGMRYAGGAEATFVLEVYRRRDDPSIDPWEWQTVANQVTVNVCKNKRPPSKTGEADLFLDPATGMIRPFPQAPDVDVDAPASTASRMFNAVRTIRDE